MPDTLSTPAAIKALRKRLGLTQAQFASLLGVARSTVVRWEGGMFAPDVDLVRFAEMIKTTEKEDSHDPS